VDPHQTKASGYGWFGQLTHCYSQTRQFTVNGIFIQYAFANAAVQFRLCCLQGSGCNSSVTRGERFVHAAQVGPNSAAARSVASCTDVDLPIPLSGRGGVRHQKLQI
jgi:hypothetical protein